MNTIRLAIVLVSALFLHAFAQTQATLYRTIDGGIRHVTNASPAAM